MVATSCWPTPKNLFFFFKRLEWDSNPGPSDHEAMCLTGRPARNTILQSDF